MRFPVFWKLKNYQDQAARIDTAAAFTASKLKRRRDSEVEALRCGQQSHSPKAVRCPCRRSADQLTIGELKPRRQERFSYARNEELAVTKNT